MTWAVTITYFCPGTVRSLNIPDDLTPVHRGLPNAIISPATSADVAGVCEAIKTDTDQVQH